MPSHRQEDPLPSAYELASNYKVERMVLVKRRRAIFRRRRRPELGDIAVIVVETDDGWWHIDKLVRGKVLASKKIRQLPMDTFELVTGKAVPAPWLR